MSTSPVSPLAADAIALARNQEFEKALDRANAALRENSADAGLNLFIGFLHSRLRDLPSAAEHFSAAHRLAPNDPIPRLELARVLIALGQLDEADRLLDAPNLPQNERLRLKATILNCRGDLEGAVELYRQLAEADANDFDAWSSLGINQLSLGDAKAAVASLEKSLSLHQHRPRIWEKWADAHKAAGTAKHALAKARDMAADNPGEPSYAVTAARLEDLLGYPEQAVARLESALEASPDSVDALVALAELSERENRLDRLTEIIDRLGAITPTTDRLPLLKAQLAYRQRDFDAALELAQSAPETVLPGTRARVIGQVLDRRGDAFGAWAAFATMNAEDRKIFPRAPAEGHAYRSSLAEGLTHIVPGWLDKWSTVPPPSLTPAFIVGFPRSGTTLLDTFLMGHPDLCVSEENPLLEEVSQAAGRVMYLPAMSAQTVEQLRNLYFETADRFVPGWRGRTLVDKLPFALVAGAYIHRLFPGAPIVFVERHPCDVVLSCFFTRFDPSGPAANFLDIVETAKLYDLMMRYWTRCREVLPLNVHEVRYERLVESTADELRSVSQFLGLDWSDAITENRATAQNRGFIKTPSYDQVIQPVYSRSVSRWTMYREQMGEAVEILRPWIEALGYED